MLENGLEKCNCKKVNCLRHGNCSQCIEVHKTKKYEPYCKREKNLLNISKISKNK